MTLRCGLKTGVGFFARIVDPRVLERYFVRENVLNQMSSTDELVDS